MFLKGLHFFFYSENEDFCAFRILYFWCGKTVPVIFARHVRYSRHIQLIEVPLHRLYFQHLFDTPLYTFDNLSDVKYQRYVIYVQS